MPETPLSQEPQAAAVPPPGGTEAAPQGRARPRDPEPVATSLWRDSADAGYMDDLREARRQHAHPLPHLIVLILAVMVACFITWASVAEVEEVTTGMGKVVPSARIQVIQNLEGGILAELAVHEGQEVERGQELLRIDNTSAASTFRDQETHQAALLAAIQRLQAEAEGSRLDFPPQLARDYPALVETERQLYESQRSSLAASLGTLEESHQAARKEYAGLEATVIRLAAEAEGSRPEFPADLAKEQPLLLKAEMALYRARQRNLNETVGSMRRSLALARQELAMNRPLVKKGVVSEIEVLRLERQVNELQGKITEELNGYRKAAAEELSRRKAELLRVQRQVSDFKARIEDRKNLFRTKAREELSVKKAELARLKEALVSTEDRYKRTLVRAPVRGTVKKIHVTTIGGVIKPGQDIMELVPLDDTLLVEAQVKPADIAFITPGQKATVKVTAYDYSIYGGLEGEVEHISADTIQERGREPYYLVNVRTRANHLSKAGVELPIKAGMTTTVDILTGKKTVLEYLLKPLIKAKYQALRER